MSALLWIPLALFVLTIFGIGWEEWRTRPVVDEPTVELPVVDPVDAELRALIDEFGGNR